MKTVLVTGGTRGIGRACVELFAENGFKVAFLYKSNDKIAAEISEKTSALGFKCDVSDPGEVKKTVLCVAETLGGIDVLVNNAGISHFGLFNDVDDLEWRRVLDTDLSSAFYVSREAVGYMLRNQSGRIINIGSVWGRCGASCEAAYSAAKAGLRGLTLSLAKELGPSGITVNCVEPGVIETDMNACFDDETLDALREETPLCRLGKPIEVAEAVFFLASEKAAFITGQCLGVDGGFSL